MRCGGEGVAVWLESQGSGKRMGRTAGLGQEIPGNWKSGRVGMGTGKGRVNNHISSVENITRISRT